MLLARCAQRSVVHGRTKQGMELLGEARDILERISLPAGAKARLSQSEIIHMCRVFGDIEVLSRLGRIYKDQADYEWQRDDIPFDQLRHHSAAQSYEGAFEYYNAAFESTHAYYPGGNAAVTALLAGNRAAASRIARQVARICLPKVPANQSPNDRYWVLATEADMALIHGDAAGAARFYRTAFDILPDNMDIGLVQTSYDQLCRLYRALGEQAMKPALAVFRNQHPNLSPGPLGDCGGAYSHATKRK